MLHEMDAITFTPPSGNNNQLLVVADKLGRVDVTEDVIVEVDQE